MSEQANPYRQYIKRLPRGWEGGGGRERGMTADGFGAPLGGNENGLKLDTGDGYTYL